MTLPTIKGAYIPTPTPEKLLRALETNEGSDLLDAMVAVVAGWRPGIAGADDELWIRRDQHGVVAVAVCLSATKRSWGDRAFSPPQFTRDMTAAMSLIPTDAEYALYSGYTVCRSFDLGGADPRYVAEMILPKAIGISNHGLPLAICAAVVQRVAGVALPRPSSASLAWLS